MEELIIRKSVKEAYELLEKIFSGDLCCAFLYGSCARGDYREDSDIDIAIMTKSGRLEAKKYNTSLAELATILAIKYNVIVNFVCIPYEEYEEKKSWYPYFASIEREGIRLDGTGSV